MAFKTSTEAFQSVFMHAGEEEVINDFFDILKKYLRSRIKYTEAKLLYEWIESGKSLYGFLCRQDLVRDMADSMINESIPFLCVTEPRGDVGFLIRSCDTAGVEPLKKNVLNNKAKYCEMMTSDELKKRIMQEHSDDKNILYLSGLSNEQAAIMQEICDEELDDIAAMDRMKDGTYTFSFYGKRTFEKKINQIIALMLMRSMGFFSKENQRLARNKRLLDIAVAKGFNKKGVKLDKTPAWVVGRGNHYMKFDGNGFEYGVAVSEGGFHLEEQYSVDISTPDYQQQMNSYLARISDKTFTYDTNQAIKHLQTKNANLNYSVSNDQKLVRMFEKEIVAKADEMVSERLMENSTMQTPAIWNIKLNLYMGEMAKLLDGARMDALPEGYRKSQIEELQKICENYGLVSIDPKTNTKKYGLESYLPALSKMRHMELTIVQTTPKHVKDIQAKIDSYGERVQTHNRNQELSRD